MKLRKDDREYLSKLAAGLGQASFLGFCAAIGTGTWLVALLLGPLAVALLIAGLLLNRKGDHHDAA